jgi:hypothetical protein
MFWWSGRRRHGPQVPSRWICKNDLATTHPTFVFIEKIYVHYVLFIPDYRYSFGRSFPHRTRCHTLLQSLCVTPGWKFRFSWLFIS